MGYEGGSMSSQYETWYFVKDGKLYEHWETDGYAMMRRGAEPKDYYICTVDEAKTTNPEKLRKALEHGKDW